MKKFNLLVLAMLTATSLAISACGDKGEMAESEATTEMPAATDPEAGSEASDAISDAAATVSDADSEAADAASDAATAARDAAIAAGLSSSDAAADTTAMPEIPAAPAE